MHPFLLLLRWRVLLLAEHWGVTPALRLLLLLALLLQLLVPPAQPVGAVAPRVSWPQEQLAAQRALLPHPLGPWRAQTWAPPWGQS